MITTHEINEAEFSGDAFYAQGVAVYEVTCERDFSSDCGGVDGMDCERAELIAFKLDGLSLTRTQIVEAVGERIVAEDESRVVEFFSDNPEMMEAA